MVRRFRPWLLLFLVVLFPHTLLAQLETLGTIAGQIRVAPGDVPSHQVLVELRLHGATVNSTYCDERGQFSFGALTPNPYRVVINDDAYYPVDVQATVNPETPNTIVQIFLQPREETKKDDPTRPRPSGANPFLANAGDYNKQFPKKALKEYERGLDAERKGKRDEAITHYLDALKIAPDYYPAHNNLGALYVGKSDFKSAEKQFDDAIQLDQNDAQAYFNLGNVLLMTRRYAESEIALSSGLQRRPDSAFGRFLEGCLYERTARFAQADASLHRAVELDPAMWQAQLQIANLYLQQNRREEAIAQLETFLKSFPSVPAAAKAKEVLQKLQAKPLPVKKSPQ